MTGTGQGDRGVQGKQGEQSTEGDSRPRGDRTNEESGRAALGRTLAYLRAKAGKSLAQLAEETAYDKSYLWRLEVGQRLSKRAVMEDLDRYYGTGDLLVRLWTLARKDVYEDRYKEAVRLEASATMMQIYTPGMPGLLQTEDFARATMSPPWFSYEEAELAEEQVAGRMARQQRLAGGSPPDVRFLIDEAALRRPLPDARIWAGQLRRLVEATAQPSLVIQVLPFTSGAHPLMNGGGSLTLLWQADGSAVAYMEGNACGEVFEEQAVVTRYRRIYDRLRDQALSPEDSAAFIKGMWEGHQSWSA